MKKLLTILALAALLCLVCSAAMADTIIYTKGYTVDDYTALAALVNTTIKVDGKDITITSVPALSAVKKADHSADAYVNAYGKVGTNDCVVEIYMKTTHRAMKKDTDLSKDSTCGANGVLVKQCPDCSKSTSEVVEKTGNHTKKDVFVAATCVKGSHTDTVCTVCGETLKAGAEANDKIPHNFTAASANYNTSLDYWKLTRPVCSADSSAPEGKAERLCAGCKKTYKQATEDESNKYTGSEYKVSWKLPTDFTAYANFMMFRGEIIPATYDGHDWDNAVEKVEADCVHAAGIKKWCKRCSTYVFEADKDSKPLAPVWVVNSTDARPWNCAATTVDLKCSLCNGNKSIDHYVTAANVAKTAKTAKDNNGVSGTKAVEQTYPSYIEATITGTSDKGTYTGIKLTVNVYHNWKEVDGTEVTVKQDKNGTALIDPCQIYKVKQVKCSVTGCTVATHYIVSSAAPDHKYSSWKLIDDGNGNTETKRYERICSACKQRQVRAFTDETLPVEHKADGSECTFVDDKDYKYTCGALNDVKMVCECGNTKIDYDRYVEHAPGAYSETIYKAATCKEEGLKFWKCTNCNKDGKYEIIAKTEDHAWDEGVITTPATKEADGVKTFTCKDCGTTKTEAVKYVVTADPKYTLKATYNGGVVSGSLAHVDDTKEAANQFVRVTFYIGTYYMATTAEVNADGTFAVEGVGPIDYITVVPTGNSAVNPSEVQRIGEAQEIFVK